MLPAPYSGPKVLLFRGTSPISAIIRWQTRGAFAHAGLLLRSGQILESYEGDGVRVRDWPTDPAIAAGIHAFDVLGMTRKRWDAALRFAAAQVGKGYDWWAIVRFISRRHMPDNDRWFCSELVFAALAEAGVHLLHRTPAWAVSPAMLSTSPLLVPAPGCPGSQERLLTAF